MPSEGQTQEPRDRGPLPPVTRAGRNAQLAKAAATSPAPERRPRGRPRKDVSSGRSVPPTPPPPPLPPPPPPPKSRKKGRSRGRAQVEDEESMDAMEKKSPQSTEVLEKTPRSRRSASRRKSSTNPGPEPEPEPGPEPDLVRLSPEPDPDPSPPHPDPDPPTETKEEEEGNRSSPTPPAPLPPCSSGEEPAVACPAPNNQVESEGACPAEQSPCSSPPVSPVSPVSPCPRLEDEDSLSPLFQCCLSEDSGSSPTASLGHTEKHLKQCAFCYRGDDPPLGQGRLVVFGPTPGYIPLHILNRRASSDRDSDCHDHCYRHSPAPPTCRSPEHSEVESCSEFVDQLGSVGLPHDINVQSLFDPTGQCCAHLQCAAWSEGVCRGEGSSLLYVDKAIDSGSTQVCVFCHRLGASLRCQQTDCGRRYHFPCAAAAGAHQDWNQRLTLCTRHIHTVSVMCVSCSSGGDAASMLMCCCCGNHYHGRCLDPALTPSSLCRAGWQCPHCRVCQCCRLRGDEDVMLVCECCHKAYHTHCLTPPLALPPMGGWSCKNCRVCRSCGVRSSGQWANHPFLCESCDPALPCPFCGHAPDLFSPQDYVTCVSCYRCVHTECVVRAGEDRTESYSCLSCRPQDEVLTPHAASPHSPTPALPLSPNISQPPTPSLDNAPVICTTSHSPVHPMCSEPTETQTKTTPPSQQSHKSPHPDPTELRYNLTSSNPTEHQQSPAASPPNPTEPYYSTAPLSPNPTVLQHTPGPSSPYPTELKESPAPFSPNPTELQQSLAPLSPYCTELQESPVPSKPMPTELQQSLAPLSPNSTELQHSPTPLFPNPTDPQKSPAPLSPNPTELQKHPAQSPPKPTEPQQSPAPSSPNPTQLQQSPAPSSPSPTQLQQSPAPSSPSPTQLQQSPAPSSPSPTQLQQSPAPSSPSPTQLQQSPAPSSPSPTQLQQSPAPSSPSPTQLQQSPAPSSPSPTQLQQSPAPSSPSPTQLQQSPAPSSPSPTQLQQSPAPSSPSPTQLQQSPAPSSPNPTELQQSPAPSSPNPTELQQSPAASSPNPTELHQSTAPSSPNPTELHQSPAPSSPNPTELQQSPAPSSPNPTELQQSPAPSSPNPTELHQSPVPSSPSPTELHQSPVPSSPNPTELHHSPAPSSPNPTEIHHSPAPSSPNPTELQKIPAPLSLNLAELPQNPRLSHSEPSEIQKSPMTPPRNPAEPKEDPLPSDSDHLEGQSPADSQKNPLPSQSCDAMLQKGPLPSCSIQAELETSHLLSSSMNAGPQQSLKPGPPQAQESSLSINPDTSTHSQSHSPSPQLHQNSVHETSPPAIELSATRETESQLVSSPSGPSQNTAEPLYMARESHQLSMQGSPMSGNIEQCPKSPPPQTLTQAEISQTTLHLEHAPHLLSSPPLASAVQDINADGQSDTPSNPDCITQPQNGPQQNQHSTLPEHSAEFILSHPNSTSAAAQPTLDQESPGLNSPAQLQCRNSQNISTLDEDCSSLCISSTLKENSHALLRPCSAPCSPSTTPCSFSQRSLSQPPSPVQGHSTKPAQPLKSSLLPILPKVAKMSTSIPEVTSLEPSQSVAGQTQESSHWPTTNTSVAPPAVPLESQFDASQSNLVIHHHSSPTHAPAVPTPESLVHSSTSVEHSSLPSSSFGDDKEENPPLWIDPNAAPDSPSQCTDAVENANGTVHLEAGLTSSGELLTSSDHITADAETSAQPSSPMMLTDSSSQRPIGPPVPDISSSPQLVFTVTNLVVQDHPISSPREVIETALDHSSHCVQPDISLTHPIPTPPLHDSPTQTSPVQTDDNSGCSLIDSVRAPEISCSSVCSTELIQITHSGQTNLSHVKGPCSPSDITQLDTSSPPDPASRSPPHCKLIDAYPDSSGQTVESIDVGCKHSPPQSSPTSPVPIEKTSSVLSFQEPFQAQISTLAVSTCSSPTHDTVTPVSPNCSPEQSGEPYCSPTCSPPPNTEASSRLSVAQLSPVSSDVDLMASNKVPGHVLPNTVEFDTGPVKTADSTSSSSCVLDGSSADRHIGMTHMVQCGAGSHPTLDRSTVESQDKMTSEHFHQKPATPVKAPWIQASCSPVHSNSTQANAVIPGSSHTSETFDTSSTPLQDSLPPQCSSVPCSPVPSPVCRPLQSHDNPETEASLNPGPASPVRPETPPGSVPATTMRLEATHISGPFSFCDSLASTVKLEAQLSPRPICSVRPEDSLDPTPTSPSQREDSPGPDGLVKPETSPNPGPMSPLCSEQSPGPEVASSALVAFMQAESIPSPRCLDPGPAIADVGMVEEPEAIDREVIRSVEKPDQRAEQRVEEDTLAEQTRRGDQTLVELRDSKPPSGAPLVEDHQAPPQAAMVSPYLPQPAPASPRPPTPHSALPSQQSPSSPSHSLAASSQSSPLRAGSLEPPHTPFPIGDAPSPSPLEGDASRPAPIPSSPLEDHPQEEEPTCQKEGIRAAIELPCHVASLDEDGLSESLLEPVAVVTQATKDQHQSHAQPSERVESPDTVRPVEEEADEEPASHQAIREKEEEDEGEGPRSVREDEQEVREEGSVKKDEEEVREVGSVRKDEEELREAAEEDDQSEVEEEPVSPVLELDPSLDMEVMELMRSSSPPPSLLHLSSLSLPPVSPRGKGCSLRPPPGSSRPSDDLSIRLRQSPFSTEASPETSPSRAPVTPPPLSPPSPPLRSSHQHRENPPTTVLPLTPKIGMGKPAISKRKFSPGRARVKQGSWWSNRRAVSPPSSSQDSTGEGGCDSPKPRPLDSSLWSMRVGRGSGFPGRRRSRGGGIGGGRGGRGRSRLKTQESVIASPGFGAVDVFQVKDEEENSMHNTVVMFSTSDYFTLRQDMCVVCGSFGQGAEGRLLACSQCGQCYHPYCVNVKITRVILTKGWRCLECTVCEACGEASDPGRLLLCDDCDISYHTYCLDPPLHTVPKGAWKCKWCVCCVQCGSTSPGLHCDWQSNYSRCGPCGSLSCCPLCLRHYSHDDLILQCQQCDRWVHAVCHGLSTEDEVEAASDEGFACSLCRTHSRGSYGRLETVDSPYMAQIVPRIREPDTKTYTQDGVCLTESGLSHLQSLVEPLTSPRRYRSRCKPKLKLRIINQNSVSVLQTPELDLPTEQEHGRGDLECEIKSDSSPERDHAHDDDVVKEPEVAETNKKRKRKPYRPGIGGFMVRQRGGKSGPSRIKLCRKDSSETLMGQDEDVTMEMTVSAEQTMEKVKKRYRKKKTKLEEAFPSYLQEAFFGRDLLDHSRQEGRKAGPEAPASLQSGAHNGKGPTPSEAPSVSMATNKKPGALPMSEDALVDLSDVLNTDPHILATEHTGQFQRSPSPFAGLDISSMADEHSLTSEPTGSGGRAQRLVQEEPLDAILSPELDKMVTDGAILSKLYKIPELEGKDVEEVFTAVLSPGSGQSDQSQHTHSALGSRPQPQQTGCGFPRLPLMNGLTGAAPHFSNPALMPSAAQSGFRIPPAEGPAPGSASRLATASQTPGEGEQDAMSTAQRSMLKWEKEETLGELATVAPVLYCNTNFPQLREQYPDWSTRVKQIAKLWRKASSQDRAPYVQKARDNRAAQRINKVQLSNEPLKRQQPSQPAPGLYDPVSMEMEVAFKDPLRPKETEQEQEWKFRQGEVNDRWGAGKKRQENLPQSKVLKSPTDTDCPYQASVAGGGKEALQMRQKSKQLAKIEATQKLEQVKNEQLLQQRQQQLLSNQGAVMSQPASGGGSSPLQLPASREAQTRQNLLQGSGLADDVFLRPQAPPPSSPLHQPPSSPQMFSPPSSRPSSPWDPYSKSVGTPRPASSQAPPQQQRSNSLSASPAHDALGSPALSPDSKTPDISRTLGPQQQGLQQSRPAMMSPSSSSAPDHTARHAAVRVADSHQRTLVQGGIFKAPMPPQHQMQQELFSSVVSGGRRDPSRPTELGFAPPQSQDPPFPSSPLSGLGSPHRSPYSQTPGTPRLDYSQQINDTFAQQSPMTSRPSPDPYSNPQTPGTPRPHSDPAYLNSQPVLRLEQFNQPVNHRPSPSHNTYDPYASNPGTPRPSVSERFPRSPGGQRTSDPYSQTPSTQRPSPDPYAQQPSTPRPQKTPDIFNQTPVETFTPQPARSPLAPGLPGEVMTFTPQHHQQSPGRQQQDSFSRTPSSQTPKHTGMSEETGFTGLVSQTPGHDQFEQGHMMLGPSQIDKTAANDMTTLGIASLDGAVNMLPQLGDSEEKLRQRQRLRQLILRQQQQKSALRQEKGLQEAASGAAAPPAAPPGPAGSSATPRHWSQEDSASGPPADVFGRPPPPYPGTVRPAGVAGPPRFPGAFPGEQPRGFPPSDAPFPRHNLPRELGVRGPVVRFGTPPGAPAGLQEHFLRPPQVSVPGSGLSAVDGLQTRRPMPGEFTGIRLLAAPNSHPQVLAGVPQPFLPRSLPIQQHSIMGQPYIELRHRAPENRLRLPFSLAMPQDPDASMANPRDPLPSAVRPGQGARMAEAPLSQQMVVPSDVEQLNQPEQQPLGAALGQSSDLSGADVIEEHLEDSAVKDLEDVEVKDLVDLNLNLDPEDGKEDLDLGPNDLHLDDFLLSGKFDLIAYADPELNLEDKKDMFNEELDLGEPEEKEGGGRKDELLEHRKTENHLMVQVKQEGEDSSRREVCPPQSLPGALPLRSPPQMPTASSLLTKDKREDSASAPGAVPALQAQEQAASSGVTSRNPSPMAAGSQPGFQQRLLGSGPGALLALQSHQLSSHPGLPPQPAPAPPHPMPLPLSQSHLLQPPPHPDTSPQTQNQNKSKLLLLEEQPLLLQDLLDQERQEQQQQKQMQALIRHKSTPDPAFPDMADFDSISDPIMKAKMVALKGINKVMTQGNLGLNPMVINRFQPAAAAPDPEGALQPPQPLKQDGKLKAAALVRPTPPSFGPGFVNESQRRQYEEWLGETQQLLQMQQRLLEDQIAGHRKAKKALSAKQRTAKKAGRALAEEDAAQLRFVTEQQGTVQKQLEQIRKQQKDHTELIEDYRTKHQRVLAPPAAPPTLQQLPSSHPNIPAAWTPGVGAPGVVGQRMPLAQPAPAAMVPRLTAPTGGFTSAPRGPAAGPAGGQAVGPAGGPNGATGDAAAPTPQVKFDDNNPFSEGFQERERRERLREQQERQRVQLMQEVERQRVLQQRLELEQQGLLGTSLGPGAQVGPPGPAGAPGSGPGGDGLSQMPFFSSELPQDFLQSPPASRPHPLQGQGGAPFTPQGFPARPPHPAGLLPGLPAEPLEKSRQRVGAAVTPSQPGGQPHLFGHDSSSSSPSNPLPPSFPCLSSGGSASLIQLYSDIIPNDKPKKKRSRRMDGDDSTGGARTPLSSHSDDLTAPPTPAISDTCSTPTLGSIDLSDLSLSQSLAPSAELERQLPVSSTGLERGPPTGLEPHSGPPPAVHLEVKEEQEERGSCRVGLVKMEDCGGDGFSSPLHGDAGKELLRHLLKDKVSPGQTPPPPARRQLSTESVRSEEEEGAGSHGSAMMDSPCGDLLDPSSKKKPQRCKRAPRLDRDKGPPKYKRRKKEEEDTPPGSTSNPLITHLRQLSVLPLMEPVLGINLSLFPPYGSSSLGRDSRLSGSFGNASLDGVTDYYSQLIYKQNNLSNPPTPPSSLPPTPPPVARQKLLNGFASTEELNRKELANCDVKGVSTVKQKGEELLALNHTSRTVDVPASLPTPPHTNQEELRVQESLGRDSPDGFVPSSSPESIADVEVSRYPDLTFIKLEPPSPCPSPPLPIMPCAWGKGSAVKQEVKVEPNHQAPPSCSNADLVTIAITLNPVAAQNVPGVMAAVAELLRVPVPVDYQLSPGGGPERSSLALLAGVRVPQVTPGSRQLRALPGAGNPGNSGVRMDYNQHGDSAASRPQCCSYCKVLLGNGMSTIRQCGASASLLFCSPNCSALSRAAGNQAVCDDPSAPSRVQHQYTNNMSSIAVHSLAHTAASPPPTSSSSPPLNFPSASTVTMEIKPRVDSLKVTVKLKPHPRAVSGGEDSPTSRHGKRLKGSRWRRWSVSILLARGPCGHDEVAGMPTEEEVDALLKELGACLHPDPLPKDQRRCCFCHQQGDGRTDGPARLLNLDLDLWVHLNCALWSSEVYETQAGALINVELALRRGLSLRCAHCQRSGATSGCNRLRCTNTYHFTCALQAHCTFFKDKTMLCHLHKPRMALSGDRSSGSSPSSTPGLTTDPPPSCDPYDSELRCFAVFRRVYVQRDEARQIAAVVQRGERQHTFRVGSLLFRSVGRLLPQQMAAFHSQTAIFPVGFHTDRIYWSMRHLHRRCKYMCYVEEADRRPLFKVKVVEKGHDDLVITASSPKGVWDQILAPVSELRSSGGTLKLFPVYLKGEDLFGLTAPSVCRIIESLPGVEACENYTFRYGRNPLMEWPLAFNPTGSARSEPKACQAKRPYLLTSIASRCQGSVGSIVGVVPGVVSLSPGETVAGAHQGRHSKAAQYRRMKAEWKTNVYLARSRIQGLGLYAARDIEKCTMVIEYIGTIIRSEVANRKERLYESQNRGVYMFRIDNDFVIDATITGGPARYINHSCAPNCITEVVTVEKENKIIISSCRRIQRGEELSYDYKFDLEDDQHKIPCHCGAFNCRKWMN